MIRRSKMLLDIFLTVITTLTVAVIISGVVVDEE